MKENTSPVPPGSAPGFIWMPADDEKGASAAFLAKYGYGPTQTQIITGRLWLGPVPERQIEWASEPG
jgi:hypothetical protein